MKYICKGCIFPCVIKSNTTYPVSPEKCPWGCQEVKWQLKEKKEKKAEE